MEQLTLWSEAHLASLSPQQEDARAYAASLASCSNISELLRRSDLGSSSGRTFQEFYSRETMRSHSSSIHWRNSGTAWHGERLTLNSCEWPTAMIRDVSEDGSAQWLSGAGVSFLSDVLETEGGHLRRYYLSRTACRGILNRAERKGRPLPEPLAGVLRQVAEAAQQAPSH